MIYAATKSALKTEFGASFIKEEIHAVAKVSYHFCSRF